MHFPARLLPYKQQQPEHSDRLLRGHPLLPVHR